MQLNKNIIKPNHLKSLGFIIYTSQYLYAGEADEVSAHTEASALASRYRN